MHAIIKDTTKLAFLLLFLFQGSKETIYATQAVASVMQLSIRTYLVCIGEWILLATAPDHHHDGQGPPTWDVPAAHPIGPNDPEETPHQQLPAPPPPPQHYALSQSSACGTQ